MLYRQKWGLAAIAVGIAIGLRLILAWVFGAEVADVSQFHWMADIVLRGDNIYQTQGLYHYTPLPIFIPAWCLQLARFLGLPFHFVIKWPLILAEAGTVIILYWLAIQTGRAHQAFWWAMAYALNPVVIITTSFHGSIGLLTIVFCVWAYALAVVNRNRQYYRLSALSLAMAIGLRGYPVLFVPFFLRQMSLSWRQRFIYLALAGLPSAITLLPYLIVSFSDVWRDMFSYSGLSDHGWIAIARAYWYLQTSSIWLPGRLGQDLLQNSKWLFLVTYGALVLWYWWKPGRLSLLATIIATLMLFFGVYGGVSSQYLSWVVPFGIVAWDLWGLAFTIVATGSLVTFYLFFFPTILLGPFPSPWAYTQPQMMQYHMFFLAVLWLTCLGWLGKALWRPSLDT